MKKSLLCIFSALLMFSVSLFVITFAGCKSNGEDSTTAKSFELNEKEITLFVGESYNILTDSKDKLSYSSSDEQIASVDKNGFVIAISDGIAFIKVSNGDVVKECRINVLKADSYIRLNTYTTSVVVGGEKTISAQVIKNGKESDEIVDFYCDKTNATLKKSEKSIVFSADATGYYTITVKAGELSATVTVKVVSLSAAVLDAATVLVENCKTLKWSAVEGAESYTLSVNGEIVADIESTEYDIESYTADLLNGKNIVFVVMATAKSNFNYIDGLFASLVFSHDYEFETIEDFTCIKAGVVKYICSVCGKNYTQDNYLAEHKIVDGKCTVCGKLMTEKILYLYDSVNDCYYVAGADAGFEAEEVYILAEYDDGTHGSKPVKYFGTAAFQLNDKIRKVIIPESITEFSDKIEGYNIIPLSDGTKVSSPFHGLTFDGCSNLEFVSAPGIHYLPAVDNGALYYTHDNFRDCYNLTQIIVGENFYNEGRSWMRWINTPDNAEAKTDVYVKGDRIRAISTDYYAIGSETGANNNLLTGDVFYYSETSSACFKWHYAADGETVVSNGKHEFENGLCKKCNQYTDYGIKYEYDAKAETYYVGSNKTYNSENVEILSEFDDGINGKHAVTYIMNGAFSGNTKIKKVILPASVMQLDGAVFQNCPNLEYVSMTGITDMVFANIDRTYSSEKITTNNNFLNCYKLTTLIVNSEFNLYADSDNAQQFFNSDTETEHAACINIYVNADKSVSNVNCTPNGKNNLLTGKVYYKGDVNKCARWNFDEDDNIVVSENYSHDFVNGICSICGEYETNGVVYLFDSSKNTYYVAGYAGVSEELTIIGEYNDGTNGLHAVTYIKNSAFRQNTILKKVTLHSNITRLEGEVFSLCSNLEYVSMPGVSELTAENISETGIYAGEAYTTNNFMNCGKLTTLIVNKNFKVNGNQFIIHGEELTACVNIYMSGSKAESRYVAADISSNNKLLTGNVYYKGDINKCGNWNYDENGNAVVRYPAHNFVNDKCENCGEYDTQGVNYEYDSEKDCYYVANNQGLNLAEVVILASYNDGTNGEHAVSYVGFEAFKWNANIKKVILPESVEHLRGNAFFECANLEYVSMVGVKSLIYATDGDNNFRLCTKLKTVVVGDGLKTNCGQFNGEEAKIVDIYVNGTTAVSFEGNNNILGNVYYKGDLSKCGNWNYDENGNAVVRYPAHNFVNDKCENCGEYDTQGVNYEYDSEKNCYYVANNQGLNLAEVVILASYNDGTNGEHAVSYVGFEAFKWNANIKKVILPESVEHLRGNAFFECANLEYVSMVGVKSLIYATDGDNNFRLCTKLKTVVVGDGLNTNCGQFNGEEAKIVDIYVNGTTAVSFEGNNNILGNVYYKGDLSKCGNWNYDENGNAVVRYPAHNFVNDKCENCGEYDTQGVNYEYDSEKNCYYVANNQGLNLAEVVILASYNDGTNGEHAVSYVGFEAFKRNANIKKVILPESVEHLRGNAFFECANLEYVSMVGVKSLIYATDGDNNFRLCTKLKTVVVGDGLNTNCGQFNGEEAKIVDIYVNGTTAVSFEGNNNILGNVYYKGDINKCGNWNYDENGNAVVRYPAHNFVNDKCENCGEYDTQGVNYEYDSEKDCYYVANNQGLNLAEVVILASYNDGTNGEHAVSYVRNGAFWGNTFIKKVIFPESVVQLDGAVFLNCYNLEYVSMIGITDMAFKNLGKTGIYVNEMEDVITNNNFLNCGKLTVLVVNKYFNLYADGDGAQQFKKTDDSFSACINIYVNGSESESQINCYPNEANDLLSGNVYYYSETNVENCWHFVDGIPTLW